MNDRIRKGDGVHSIEYGGETYYYRYLTSRHLETLNANQGHDLNVMAFILCACTPSGEPMFTLDDYDEVLDLPRMLINTIAHASSTGNGVAAARRLIQDPDRKFILQLATSTGWSIEYCEGLDFETLSELKALNSWVPFTPERQAGQLGVIASYMSSQIHKNPLSADKIFPYLQKNVPKFLEHPKVAKARSLLEPVSGSPDKIKEKQLELLIPALEEEVEMEKAKDTPDTYVIRELSKMIKDHKWQRTYQL